MAFVYELWPLVEPQIGEKEKDDYLSDFFQIKLGSNRERYSI